jgi:GNAT superfamily N-acetyltransferase
VTRARGVSRSTGNIMRRDKTEPAISVVPANEASWEDLQTIFGTRGRASTCQCQRYKLRPRESFASFPTEERAQRLRQQTDCGHPESGTTSGLVAYLNDEPVGWCAVEPRTAYAGLLRNNRVPWGGRAEDKTDSGVWRVTCFFTRVGFRTRGISRALARAAVDFARERGARAIEGYPMTTKNVIPEELHVGNVFANAGFTEVSRPTLRHVVKRVDF